MKPIARFAVLLAPFFTNAAVAQMCPLPPAFDAGLEPARVIHVNPDGDDGGDGSAERPFRTLQRAAREATPGTRIQLSEGNHHSGATLDRLQGTAGAPVWIAGAGPERTVFRGGNQAMHLRLPKYAVLENFGVERTQSNGMNIDDAGTLDQPAEYVVLRNIAVREVLAEGNLDGIKLSGVDRFRVENCLIDNPGRGGSGIDMVGCHDGVLTGNTFRNVASSGIQAKGGSARLLIHANTFEDGGSRAINCGGSTGLAFFRPQDATYEAARITMTANVFAGGGAPVAFVGAEHCVFAHNTVYKPARWAARILQETVGGRFVECGENLFANNIVVIGREASSPLINIGPNTRPESFRFAHNLWYHAENPRYRSPDLPGAAYFNPAGEDPGFLDPEAGDFRLSENSPAAGKGGDLAGLAGEWPILPPPDGDRDGYCRNDPPALGAHRMTPAGVDGASRHLEG